MSINANVNGTKYNGIETITVGGKAINLEETGITPTGTKSITANGSHDVTQYASVDVDVPSSGITPTGTTQIKSNGIHDVTNFASAEVIVPSDAKTEQTKTVTPTKSTQTVTADDPTTQSLSSVTINPIPSQYIVPSGSQTITDNGTVDVTSLASVIVKVAGSGGGSGESPFSELHVEEFTPSVDTNATQTFQYGTSKTPDLFAIIPVSTPTIAKALVSSVTLQNHQSSIFWTFQVHTGATATTFVKSAISTSLVVDNGDGSCTVTPSAYSGAAVSYQGGLTYKVISVVI
jgi:hypothetical protein